MKSKIDTTFGYSSLERIIAIAIYHGYKRRGNSFTHNKYGTVSLAGIKNQVLKYDTKWDGYLMPVIEMIEKSGYLFENTRYCDDDEAYYARFQEIDKKWVDGKRDKNGNSVYKFESYYTVDKIDAAFFSVSDFCIDWCQKHNKNFEVK